MRDTLCSAPIDRVSTVAKAQGNGWRLKLGHRSFVYIPRFATAQRHARQTPYTSFVVVTRPAKRHFSVFTLYHFLQCIRCSRLMLMIESNRISLSAKHYKAAGFGQCVARSCRSRRVLSAQFFFLEHRLTRRLGMYCFKSNIWVMMKERE